MSWALRESGPLEVPRHALPTNAAQAGAAVRTWLDISDDEQASWRDDRAALRSWRSALEDRGVLVFIVELGRDEVRGFSAWDDRAPLIVANLSGVTPAARSFTIAHELGHLVAREDATCIEPHSEETLEVNLERWCERFGAALLMPEAAVHRFVTQHRVMAAAADLDTVKAAIRAFRVSARAAALRLIDLGYAKQTLYRDVLRVFVPASSPRPTESFARPSRAVARVREYGPRTIETILRELPPRDALATLRLTVGDVRRIANEAPGVPTP